MLLLGVILAFSLLTFVVVLASCAAQAETTRRTASVQTLVPGPPSPPREPDEFDRIVASLAADPDFGRIDWYRR